MSSVQVAAIKKSFVRQLENIWKAFKGYKISTENDISIYVIDIYYRTYRQNMLKRR